MLCADGRKPRQVRDITGDKCCQTSRQSGERARDYRVSINDRGERMQDEKEVENIQPQGKGDTGKEKTEEKRGDGLKETGYRWRGVRAIIDREDI